MVMFVFSSEVGRELRWYDNVIDERIIYGAEIMHVAEICDKLFRKQ